MRKILSMFVVLVTLAGCGLFSDENIHDTIGVASDVISALTTILKPATDTAFALCEAIEKNPDGRDLKLARFECAQINDAWIQVQQAAEALQAAINMANTEKIAKAEEMLREAEKELLTIYDNAKIIKVR